MPKRTKIGGDEFIRRVLDGERYFSNIELEPGLDLTKHEGYVDFLRYLKNTTDLNKNPFVLNYSSFRFLKAPKLYFPFAQGIETEFVGADLKMVNLRQANFKRADFRGANLWRGDFYEANLKGANLRYTKLGDSNFSMANLENASFENSILEQSDFWASNLKRTNFRYSSLIASRMGFANVQEADFEGADVRGAKGLEFALRMHQAKFLETIVSEEEEKIIEKVLDEGKDPFLEGIYSHMFGTLDQKHSL